LVATFSLGPTALSAQEIAITRQSDSRCGSP
jgi:hypothetical protein